jgi:hypothetical protein
LLLLKARIYKHNTVTATDVRAAIRTVHRVQGPAEDAMIAIRHHARNAHVMSGAEYARASADPNHCDPVRPEPY